MEDHGSAEPMQERGWKRSTTSWVGRAADAA